MPKQLGDLNGVCGRGFVPEFKSIGRGFVSPQVSNILEKHLLVAMRTLKKLCLTVPLELTDSLLTLVSYFAKIDTICVRCSRLILCEELVS